MFTLLRRLFKDNNPIDTQLQQLLELPIQFRVYCDEDFDACVALYKDNQSQLPNDGGVDFVAFLKGRDKTLIVATFNGNVVGFGGIVLKNSNVSVLCYGIVSPKYKGYRIGTTLTLLRISLLSVIPGGYYIVIFALEYSLLFYSRFGFVEAAEWKSGDGCVHPVGVMYVSEASLHKIKSTLLDRGIKVDGGCAPQSCLEPRISVTQSSAGRFNIQFKTVEQVGQ